MPGDSINGHESIFYANETLNGEELLNSEARYLVRRSVSICIINISTGALAADLGFLLVDNATVGRIREYCVSVFIY